jgi:O-antigen/teichoic acid export membrane protein
MLFGVTVTHIQQYSYLYLIGAVIGSEAVAEVSASRLLLMPLTLINTGWRKIVVPHGSRLREQQKIDLFFKDQVVTSLIFIITIGLYVTLLLTFFGVLQNFLLTEKYTSSLNYILLWGVIFAIRFIGLNASSGMLVTKKFQTIAKANFITMLITIGCAYYLIQGHGIKGGLTALIIGEAMLALGLWFYFGKAVFSKQSDRSAEGIKEDLVLNPAGRDSSTVLED